MLLISLVVLLLPLAEAVPSEVTGVMLSVVSGQAALMVNWDQPSSDSTIIRYEVEYGERGVRWIAIVPVQGAGSLTTTITNLQRGTTYIVRVRAVSGAGVGDYTVPQRRPFVLLPNLPPQVTGVSLSIVSGQAAIRVAWTMASVEGTFSRYEVQYKISSQSWDASTTETVVDQNVLTVDLTTLQRGTTYSVRVRAVSNGGNGPYSTEDTTATVPNVPNVPPQVTGVSLSVVSGQATIRVTWTKPSVEGTFTRYDVQPKTSSQNWGDLSTRQVTGENTVTVDFSSLQRGTTYNVRVRAVSNAGNGPYSEEATSTVPRPPAAVSGVHVTVMDGVASIPITVTWIPPQSDLPITRYQVDFSELLSSQPQLTPFIAPPATFTGTSGASYKVRVRAESTAGFGGWSPHTTIASPSVPTGVTATSSNPSSVTITWNDESFKYRIFAQREGSNSERTTEDLVSPPHTITGLDSNTRYTITIEAYGPVGQAGMNINGYTLPEAPSSLNLQEVSSAVIRVTWTAPPNADRLPLTYLISYQSEFGSGMKEVSTQPVELTGLHPFAEYTVGVQARNTGGQLSGNVTEKSTTLSAAPSSPPQSVQIVDRLKTQDNLTWTWQLPDKADRNGIITSYVIIFIRGSGGQHQPVGSFTKVLDNPTFNAPTDLTYTFTSLSANTFYSIRIAAVTSGGTGVFSALQTIKTTLDLYVSMLSIQVTSDTSSTISWAAPEGVDSVSSYKVYYTGVYQSGAFIKRTTTTTSVQLSSLTPEVPIDVSVSPVTSQGTGGPVSRTFFTKEAVPTVPVKDVTVMRIDSVSLRVSWTPLSLHEARGWPLYTVIVEAAGCNRATITRNTYGSFTNVAGLDPSTSYSVRVQVGTLAGTSATLISDSVEIQAPVVDPTSSLDSNVGAIVGAFVAGLVAGVLGLLLVIGIVFGACKLTKQPNINGSKENGSDPNAVEMTECPAYESVDKAYEDVDQTAQQRYVARNEEYAIIN